MWKGKNPDRVHILFVDYKHAYDSVIGKKLYEAMGMLGIPQKDGENDNETWNRVTLEGNLSMMFVVRKDLRQGDSLSLRSYFEKEWCIDT